MLLLWLALPRSVAAQPAPATAEAWLEEARAAWRDRRDDDATAALERAAPLITDLESLEGSDLFEGRGVVALLAGDHEAAWTWTRRALDLRLRLDPGSERVARAWGNLHTVAIARGDLPAAAAAAREALALRDAVGDPAERVRLCWAAARSLHKAGATAEARAALATGVDVASRALPSAHSDLIGARSMLATLHLALNELDEAERHLRAVVDARATLPVEDVRRAGASNNLGLVFFERGDLIEARSWFERALDEWTAGLGPDHPHVATAATNLGSVLNELGDLEAAAALHRRALTIRRSSLPPDDPEISTSLTNLAVVLSEQGRRDDTIVLLREALEGLDPEQLHTARIEVNLAAAWIGAGDLAAAEPYLTHARAVAERRVGLDHPVQGDIDLQEARLRAAQGRGVEAAALAERAVSRARAALGPDHPSVAAAALHRARLDPAVAAGSIEEALQVLERRLVQIEALSDREAILLRREGDRTLTTWFSIHDDPTRGLEAWVHATAWKGAAARRAVARGGPAFDALVTARRDLAAAAWSTEGTPEERAATLSRLTARRDALERSWTGGEAPPQPGDICDALGRREALIDVLALSDSYAVFVVDRKCRPERVDLPRAEVDAAVSHLLRLAADPSAPPTRRTAAADLVRRRLWDPIAPLVGPRDVIVSPDGSTALVPWGALPVDPQASSFLLEHRVFVTVDRPSDLLRPTPPWGDRAVLVGGVDPGPPSPGCGTEWTPLPGTAREIDRVAARWPGHVDRLSGAEATKEALAARAPGAALIHVASHGFFGPSACSGGPLDPMLASGFVLAGANRGDGLLTAEELISIDLSGARLVVLSGCATGAGGLADGEGVIGLRRALSRAGATRVATTLWPVDDGAIVPFVDTFYALLFAGGPDPAVALVGAQRAAIHRDRATGDDGWTTWAAFVVTGR